MIMDTSQTQRTRRKRLVVAAESVVLVRVAVEQYAVPTFLARRGAAQLGAIPRWRPS